MSFACKPQIIQTVQIVCNYFSSQTRLLGLLTFSYFLGT
uniref:Uncharacterized protein n=1 Tax=Anguilla anguilla TaxID=7936 RepID=A0A0E9WM00_ANGAN